MFKSSSKEALLRGIFTKVTPSRQKKEKVFWKKLTLRKDIRDKHNLKENEFRYYYSSSQDLLHDYREFVRTYFQKNEKTAGQ